MALGDFQDMVPFTAPDGHQVLSHSPEESKLRVEAEMAMGSGQATQFLSF